MHGGTDGLRPNPYFTRINPGEPTTTIARPHLVDPTVSPRMPGVLGGSRYIEGSSPWSRLGAAHTEEE
jgi:hypothetical protein